VTTVRTPRTVVGQARVGAWIAALAAAALVAACASGGSSHREAQRLLALGDRDAALMQLNEAMHLEPTNARYKIDLLREQDNFARDLIQRGDEARRIGKLDDAAEAYNHALRVQASNDRALRGLNAVTLDARHQVLLVDAERALKDGQLDSARAIVKTVLFENNAHPVGLRINAAIAEQQEKLDQAKAARIAAQSVLRKPVTLQFRDANLRMVFEALSKSTGLNVILDRDVKADLKTTIFVKDATVEDTVDLILLQNQLDRRTLNASTLFVYPATAAKQKEYQDLQVRTFQLANVDGKYIVSVLKTVLKMKDVSVDERTNTLVMRDSPEAVAVAAKVIAAHDVADPEVMLEIEVLEVDRSRIQTLGVTPPNQLTLHSPIPSGSPISSLQTITLKNLTVSGSGSAVVNFKLQDSDSNLLASPRIRARNKEKAKILIGDRIPTITNSVTPVATGSPVVTGTVQYQEVGLKLEFEPTIYSDQEVGIKLSLEVSNIVDKIQDANGSLAYQIGTRNASTSLRLRDGETQVLGGLIQDNDTYSGSKLPGPGHLPVLGALFGNNDMTRKKTEIILSITPHIIRGPAVIDAALRDIYSGTEAGLRERPLRLDPVGEFKAGTSSAPTPAATVPAGARPALPMPANSSMPLVVPRPAPGATPSTAVQPLGPPAGIAAPPPPPPPAPAPAVDPPADAAPPASPQSSANPDAAAPVVAGAAPEIVPSTALLPPATVSSAAASGAADLIWSGPATIKLGETFQVTLSGSSLPALKNLPLTVRYDPVVLRFIDASAASVAVAAGAETVRAVVDTARGRAEIPLTVANPDGLSTDGPLLTLSFAVRVGRASTQLIVAQTDVKAEDGTSRLIPAAPRSFAMRIMP
jgi:general secretion pathway protein D